MELDTHRRMALQPSFECYNAKCPAEREARRRDGDVQEHHHVVVTLAHRSERQFLRRQLEYEATTSEEERRESFSWWA